MANVLQITSGATFTIASVLEHQSITRQQSITLTGKRLIRIYQAVGFSAHEALVGTDLATKGWGWFWNKDATNFVQIGADSGGTFVPVIKLLAGEWTGWMRFPSTLAIYAKADTASVDLAGELTEV